MRLGDSFVLEACLYLFSIVKTLDEPEVIFCGDFMLKPCSKVAKEQQKDTVVSVVERGQVDDLDDDTIRNDSLLDFLCHPILSMSCGILSLWYHDACHRVKPVGYLLL